MSKTQSKHNHSCACDHENVQYCKTCKIVHCLDCKVEWSYKPITYYGYPWSYYQNGLSSSPVDYLSWGATGSTGTSTNGNSLIGTQAHQNMGLSLSTLNDGHKVKLTAASLAPTCEHKA